MTTILLLGGIDPIIRPSRAIKDGEKMNSDFKKIKTILVDWRVERV